MEFIEFLQKNRPVPVSEYGREADGEPFITLTVNWTHEAREAVIAAGVELPNEVYELSAWAYTFEVPKKYTKQVLEIIIEDKKKEFEAMHEKINQKYNRVIPTLQSLSEEANEY